ncbi:MAG: glycosyltransferase family 39 protein [Deltaproteobacteria bacterium]|nr:glycosyltransferase family 39 protein [Deltaproteobacteria bacterium]
MWASYARACRAGLARARALAAALGAWPRDGTRFAVALFVLALLPRLCVAIAWAREPVWDGHYYDYGAQRIAAGLGYSGAGGGHGIWHPWAHYPVGYSGLLGLAYHLFGHGQHVAPMLGALVGGLLAVAVYGLARHATTEGRARLAGLLTALQPGLVAYAALVMTEPLGALGPVAAAWAAARARSTWRAGLSAGLLLGLGTLVRPQTILCAPAIGLVRLGRGGRRQACGAAALCTAVALAVVAPWTARNCLVMDGCAFVSTNAGWNLAIGSFPRATGRFETLRASDGCRVVTGQVQQDRCWLGAGLGWIAAEPRRWLGLVPRKLGETFDHESFPVGYLAEADPAAWPPAQREQARRALTLAHRILLSLAPLGLMAWPRRGARAWPLVGLALLGALWAHAWTDPAQPFWPLAVAIPLLALLPARGARQAGVLAFLAYSVATVCAVHAVFFGEDRYHVFVTPMLCLLAACALGARRTCATAATPAASA